MRCRCLCPFGRTGKPGRRQLSYWNNFFRIPVYWVWRIAFEQQANQFIQQWTFYWCRNSSILRLCLRLRSVQSKRFSFMLHVVLYWQVLQPSGDSDVTDNDDKGSLPYMAPEIFEKRYKQKPPGVPAASTPVATTPYCATPTRMPSTPQAPSTPSAHSLKEQEAQKNTHRDIWAFGCVLYELATHRRPWHHILEPPTSSWTKPDEFLFFSRRFWRSLGSFHGGWCLFMLFIGIFLVL
jgi:serine/threonine protein kinase